MSGTAPTVILADDHAMVVDGLKRILSDEFTIVDVVADGQALVEAYRRHRPDIAVVDISMPRLNGIDAMRKILRGFPDAKIVLLTMHTEREYAIESFRAGAKGYVLKASAADELRLALRSALKGGVYISPAISADVLAAGAAPPDGQPDITLRQREILQLVAEGHRIKKIAAALHLSPKTVEYHKYRLMKQLKLKNTADMIQYAVRHGIVDSSTAIDPP